MDLLRDRSGCLASPLARVGIGIGLLVLVLVFVLAIAGGDNTANEPDDVTATDVTPRPTSGPATIDLADGATLDIELFIAPTATKTIIAAPSRNTDITSIGPAGDLLVDVDCANVIAFDAQTADASPITLYQALFTMLIAGDFGPIADDGFGSLGASFTALPGWEAARANGVSYSFSFAPSDTFPDGFSPDEVPMSSLFIGEDDTGFLPQFEQWKDAGFNGVTVPGADHGSALFTGPDDDVVLNRLERALCF